MATKKVLAKVDFTKGALATRIDKDVASQIRNADNVRETWRGYVEACFKNEGGMTPNHARPLLMAINAKIAAARKANHNPTPIAPLQDSRVSEAKSILMLSGYSCWPAVFDMLKGMDVSEGGRGVNAGTLLVVSKFVRSRELGWSKDTDKAPPRDKVMAAIAERAKQKRGNGEAVDRLSTAPATIRRYDESLAAILRQAKGLAKWMGKAKGSQFMTTIINAAQSAKPFAKAVAAEKAAAE